MTLDLNSGTVLAQELAQAIISNDDKAATVAGINIVGTLIDNLARVAAANERIAQALENAIVHKDAIHVRNTG